MQVTDDERREVAERLRRAWANVPDKNPARHHMRVLYEIYAAVGLNDDRVDAIDLFDRLADLIEPSEPKVRCVAEVKVDGERLEKLAHDAAAELTGIDRDALLALASGLEADADRIIRAARNARFGGGPRIGEAKHDAYEWRSIARRIREACGEEGA